MNIDISHNDNIEYRCNEVARQHDISDNSAIQLFEVPKNGTYRVLEKTNIFLHKTIDKTITP